MASIAYLNAAFLSLKKDVTKLLVKLPDIPFVDEQTVARSYLYSAEGTRMLLKIVENLTAAGEAADTAASKAKGDA